MHWADSNSLRVVAVAFLRNSWRALAARLRRSAVAFRGEACGGISSAGTGRVNKESASKPADNIGQESFIWFAKLKAPLLLRMQAQRHRVLLR